MNDMIPLKGNDRRLMAEIEALAANGLALPTSDALAERMGMADSRSISKSLERIEAAGYITVATGKQGREITVTRTGKVIRTEVYAAKEPPRAKRPSGRHMTADEREEAIAVVLDAVMAGTGLNKAIIAAGVHPSSFYVWMGEPDSDLPEKVARARELGMAVRVDEMIEIADAADDAQLARVRIDAREKAARMLAPRKFGQMVKLADADGDNIKSPFDALPAAFMRTVASVARDLAGDEK